MSTLADAAAKAEIAIVRYLLAHPEARDAVEGIEKWWLPPTAEFGTGAVAEALKSLTNDNVLSVWKSASAKPVYGLRSGDTELLRAYLRKIS